MSILGVIVRARPKQSDSVRRALGALPGLDIAAREDCRFVVVIEDSPFASAAEVMTRVTQLPDVLNTSLVYEYSGPDAPPPTESVTDFQSWRRSHRAAD